MSLMVATLSYYAAGSPRFCRAEWRVGAPLSPDQADLVEQVVAHAETIGRLSNSRGRTIESLEETFTGIAELCSTVTLDYGAPRKGLRAVRSAPANAQPGLAHLFDLPDKVTDFNAGPFLSERSRVAFETPDAYLRDPVDVGDLPKSTGTTTRDEMLRLAGRWDKIGRLLVVAADDVDPADVSGVFGVLKKEGDERIRQIINRKRRNAREYHLERRSLAMPH